MKEETARLKEELPAHNQACIHRLRVDHANRPRPRARARSRMADRIEDEDEDENDRSPSNVRIRRSAADNIEMHRNQA